MNTTRQLCLSSLLRAAVLAACAASPFASAAEHAAPAAAAVAHTRYTVTIFFPGTFWTNTAPLALNNRSQVVGSRIDVDPRWSATAIWDGKKATEWITFGNPGSVPIAINNAGKIAGRTLLIPDQRTSQRAVVWCGTTMTYLRTLGGDYGEASAINDAGDVAGYTLVGQEYHATLWKGDKPIDLGTLGGTTSVAKGINDARDVVGYSAAPDNVVYATLWKNGKVRNLGTLGGTRSEALAINNDGHVVGWSYVAGNITSHAALWVNGKIRDLGTLGGQQSVARSINRAGLIVGFSSNAEGKGRGTLWDGARVIDLNTLLDGDVTGITIGSAIAITDSGEILVSGTAPNSSGYMLLTPKKRGSPNK